MNDEALKLLLREADGGGEPAPLAAEKLLAAALRRRRRTARRRTAVGAAALLVAAGAALAWRGEPAGNSVERRDQLADADWSLKRPVQTVEELRAELARLEREAAIQVAVVRGLAAEDTQIIDDVDAASPDGGAALVEAEAARSAAITWQYATLVEQELKDLAAARHEYERVARRFPGTRWAELAAVSLERLSAAGEPAL
jgi:hypothetical protein